MFLINMGFLDSLLGKKGEDKGVKAGESKFTNPFSVSAVFSPLRLSANKKNVVTLVLKVKNNSPDAQLLSVDAAVPKNAMLGFDQASLQKTIEKKVGDVKAGEVKEVKIEVWANNQTPPGTYPIEISAYSHHVNYEKVMGYVKKKLTLRCN